MKRLATCRAAQLAATLLLTVATQAASAAGAPAPAVHAGHTGTAMAMAPAMAPSDSVYRLPMMLESQDGQSFTLSAHRGKPMVISMFYTSCQFVCPMLIDTIRANLDQLTPSEREHTDALLVSFDPARDTVPVLKSTAEKRSVDTAHWTLARTEAADARKLAAAIGIQFRKLPDGDFNHSTVLILLDAEGRIVGRTSKLGAADPAFVKLIRTALRGPQQ